jgi:hypothetical protein
MPSKIPDGAFTAEAIQKLLGALPVSLSGAADAVDNHTANRYVITRAGVDAITLQPPTPVVDDGLEIYIGSSTANAHTITCPAGTFQAGVAANTVATFPAQAGAGVFLMAFNGKWIVTGIVGAVAFT